jgi:hypothetical protein
VTVPPVDAETVNVYQNASAVIIMVDPTRRRTFDYAVREISNVPDNLDIALLINFRDLYKKWDVTDVEIEQFMRTCDPRVKVIESSLRNGFGLRHFYNFLNIPFLKTKMEHLKAQIKSTKEDLAKEEKDNDAVVEQDYDAYVKWLSANSKAPAAKPKEPAPKAKETPKSPEAKKSDAKAEGSSTASPQPKAAEGSTKPVVLKDAKEAARKHNEESDDIYDYQPEVDMDGGFFEDEDEVADHRNFAELDARADHPAPAAITVQQKGLIKPKEPVIVSSGEDEVEVSYSSKGGKKAASPKAKAAPKSEATGKKVVGNANSKIESSAKSVKSPEGVAPLPSIADKQKDKKDSGKEAKASPKVAEPATKAAKSYKLYSDDEKEDLDDIVDEIDSAPPARVPVANNHKHANDNHKNARPKPKQTHDSDDEMDEVEPTARPDLRVANSGGHNGLVQSSSFVSVDGDEELDDLPVVPLPTKPAISKAALATKAAAIRKPTRSSDDDDDEELVAPERADPRPSSADAPPTELEQNNAPSPLQEVVVSDDAFMDFLGGIATAKPSPAPAPAQGQVDLDFGLDFSVIGGQVEASKKKKKKDKKRKDDSDEEDELPVTVVVKKASVEPRAAAKSAPAAASKPIVVEPDEASENSDDASKKAKKDKKAKKVKKEKGKKDKKKKKKGSDSESEVDEESVPPPKKPAEQKSTPTSASSSSPSAKSGSASGSKVSAAAKQPVAKKEKEKPIKKEKPQSLDDFYGDLSNSD